MNDSDFVKLNAHVRFHVHDWDSVPVKIRRALCEFLSRERRRQRDRIFQELGRGPAVPDDNPVPGGSPF